MQPPRQQPAASKRPNAANHPPPRKLEVNDIRRVGGRVHWLVRLRDRDTTHVPRPAKLEARASRDAPRKIIRSAAPDVKASA